MTHVGKKWTVGVLALIVCTTGCRTTGDIRLPSFGWLKADDSAGTDLAIQTELPPPSAAAVPNKPTFDAQTATSNATLQDASTDVAVQVTPYPTTAYPKFNSAQSSTETQSTSVASNFATPGFNPGPTANTSSQTGSHLAGQANLSSSRNLISTNTSSSPVPGPYSAAATAIPSQYIQSGSAQPASASVQQGFYSPSAAPTTSSRRSTMDSATQPIAGFKGQANQVTNPPLAPTQSTSASYVLPTQSPAGNSFQAPNAAASQISNTAATTPVAPMSYNAVAPAAAGNSFYSTANQQPGAWRPGSTCQNGNCLATSGCAGGNCGVTTGIASTAVPSPPPAYQTPSAPTTTVQQSVGGGTPATMWR